MNSEEWVRGYFHLDRDEEMILIPIDYYMVGVKIVDFLKMFGEAIQSAIDNGTDVIQAIKDSDPNNELGYKEIL